jgi:hypothetical protein
MFPREKLTADFDILADRVLGVTAAREPEVKTGFRLPSIARAIARA